MLLRIVGVLVLGWLLRQLYLQLYFAWQYRAAPREEAVWQLPFLGSLRVLRWTKRLGQLRLKQTVELGTLHFRAWFFVMGKELGYAVSEPRDVQFMMAEGFDNFEKGDRFRMQFDELLGRGIFVSDGPRWKKQRGLAAHLFASVRDKVMCDVFASHMARLEKTHLEPLVRSGGTGFLPDAQDVFLRFTLDSIGEIAFGRNIGSLQKDVPFSRAFNRIQNLIISRIFTPWPFKLWFTRQIAAEARVLDRLAMTVIGEKRAALAAGSLSKEDDLVARQLLTQPTSTDVDLRDMVMNMMIAGRDTTGVLITWATYLLATHPEKRAPLVREIDAALPDRDAMPTKDDFKRMPYLAAVIKETLRLYPSVPTDSKYCVKECELPSGRRMYPNTVFLWSAYCMGRHPDMWDDAESFVPERFLGEGDRASSRRKGVVAATKEEEENTQEGGKGVQEVDTGAASSNKDLLAPSGPYKRHPWQWLPFQGGPRVCLGQKMAMLEASFVLTRLFRRYEFEYARDTPPEEVHSIILLMGGGLPLRVSTRE